MTTILSVKYEASYSFLKNKQKINWSINDFEIGMCNNIMRASKIKLLPFDILFRNSILAWLYVEDLLRQFLTGPERPERGLRGEGGLQPHILAASEAKPFPSKRMAGLTDQSDFSRTTFTGHRVQALLLMKIQYSLLFREFSTCGILEALLGTNVLNDAKAAPFLVFFLQVAAEKKTLKTLQLWHH